MKKILLLLGFCNLALLSAKADLLFYESFNYSNGPIILTGTNADGSTNWFRHSGSAAPSDSIVNNHRIEVSATGGTLSRQDDVHRNFTSFTNALGVIYASFTVNCTNLPPLTGTYFAHVYGIDTIHSQNLSTNFPGRVFAQAAGIGVSNSWRLGISGNSGTVSKILPFDLATNVNYQVVEEWDPVDQFAAFVWVNPLSSSDTSVESSDGIGSPTIPGGYGLRQASSFGSFFCNITNLACGTNWDETATNIWSKTAVAPIIAYAPAAGTNFVGSSMIVSGLAAGQGQAGMSYQWLKNGAPVSNENGSSNIFLRASAALSDTGNYQLVATTPLGLSVTSAVAFRWVTNAPIPPSVVPSTNSTVTVFYHQPATLSITASGPPTITYQWYYNNAPASGNVSDPTQPTLTINNVFTNNGTAGPYYCVASNPYGSATSGVFTVVASGPPAVSLAFLRTLVDPVNYVATNSDLRWQATGTVTTYTNITSGDTSSYYIQDNTGCGINIFLTHGGGTNANFEPRFWAPHQGDVVTFIGWLSSFNSTLELEADTNDLTTGFTILSNNLASIPPQKVIPFSLVNNLAFMETNIESSVVVLTNVYFGTNAGLTISSNANTVVTVTNAAGEAFALAFSSQDLDLTGQTLPTFAYMVAGPLTQNLGNTVTPRNTGYQINITRFSDIVTNPIMASVSTAGTSKTITWAAAPYTYSYSVQAAGNVTGPYTNIATGLRFTTFNGTYTDSSAGAAPKFYRVSAP